jgi:hypothetical protein
MSRAPLKAPPPVSRPTVFDFFLILLGCALSSFLMAFDGPTVEPKDTAANLPPSVTTYVFPLLPFLLVLPQGVVLLWPLFYSIQRIRSRPQSLTGGEWLWGFAWLGTLLLIGWAAWNKSGTPPDFLKNMTFPPHLVWYVILVPSMAVIAVIIVVIDLVSGWQQPWTHTLSVALALWPVLPLAAVLAWGKFNPVLGGFAGLGGGGG